MRIITSARYAFSVCAEIAILAACSGGGSPSLDQRFQGRLSPAKASRRPTLSYRVKGSSPRKKLSDREEVERIARLSVVIHEGSTSLR
jgi:hypothetical protein